jgi:outer membrane immunogenic protein
MIYLTYGAALAHVTSDYCEYGAYYGGCAYDANYYQWSGSATRWGWVVGIGLERAITANWTAKIEALYADLGDFNTCQNYPGYGCTYYPTQIHNSVYIARVGLNYKFDWGFTGKAAPALATKD